MNNPVSAFLLERYHIGEVNTDEKRRVEKALAEDPALALELARLDQSDRDFWRQFPHKNFQGLRTSNKPHITSRLRAPLLLAAAALILVIALPYFLRKNSEQDRIKGTAGNTLELSVYLKGNSAGDDVKLADQSDIRMGNTVQLAYRVQTTAPKYGVIFSIDGRSLVTLHYPYNNEQSTGLVSGKAVPLDEAYTLDDAPNYEMFFFVVKDKPLETANVLNSAQQLALQIAKNPQTALQQGNVVFKGCELQVLTLWKQ
jgi:hypothetical protein